MKSITTNLVALVLIITITACNSNGSKNQPSGTDTSNSIVLPEDRSSDSLAAAPGSANIDSSGQRQQSPDSLKRP